MIVTTEWTGLPLNIRGRTFGSDYVYELAKPPIRFTFSGVHESRDALYAEVRIESIEQGNEGDIMRDRISLISSRSKAMLAKTLGTRTKIAMSWAEIVELVALTTADTFREGEPFVWLDETPDDPADRAFLIADFIPLNQTTVLYGDGMSGKSLLALSMAVAVATGKPLAGIRPLAKPGRVLYLDWETTERVHAHYLRCLAKGQGIEVPTQSIRYRRMVRGLALDSARVKKEVDTHRAGFLIVDSMIPACGGEPESAEVVMTLFNAIRGIGPLSTLMVSHVTKAEAQRKGQPRPFGSVFTTNLARSTWLARRATLGKDDTLDIGLYHTKTNVGRLFAPRGIRLGFSDSSGISISRFALEDVPELSEHEPVGRRVRGILTRGAATVKDIAEQLAVSEGSVRTSLHRMQDARVLATTPGRGAAKKWGLMTNERTQTERIPF